VGLASIAISIVSGHKYQTALFNRDWLASNHLDPESSARIDSRRLKLIRDLRYRRHLIKQPEATPQDFSGRPASAESAAQPIADETRFQR
jgi:hypothetical protein